MKKSTIVASGILLVSSLVILTSAGLNDGGHPNLFNSNGIAACAGSPGEAYTCSGPGCHGAGNGSSSTGGLADNAGPGNISITSIPAMTSNQYVPGQTYSMIVTVNETGKTVFGFDAEMLDNSGSTNIAVNNTAGTLTITYPTKTRIAQPFGTGRAAVTHSIGAGFATNTATFGFNWKAPASGTVNMYGSGVAGNKDGFANAQDNVYTYFKQLTPGASGIDESYAEAKEINVLPNPIINNKLDLHFTPQKSENFVIQLISIDGKQVFTLDNTKVESGGMQKEYDVANLASGVYFLKIYSESRVYNKKIVIN